MAVPKKCTLYNSSIKINGSNFREYDYLKEVLIKLIEIAVLNDWKPEEYTNFKTQRVIVNNISTIREYPEILIFRHDFIKAFAKYVMADENRKKIVDFRITINETMEHNLLRELAIAEDRIKYLEKFL